MMIAAALGVGVLGMLTGCAAHHLDDGTPIVWAEDRTQFEKKAATLKVTPAQAYDLAWKEAVKREYPAIGKEPVMIVGEDYLFTTPSPRGVWLTGFYVNGVTGSVEFRKVDRMIYRGMVGDLLHP